MLEKIELLELWRPVVGYEGLYEVSNWGRVRSLARILDHYRYGAKSGHTYVLEGKLLNSFPKANNYLCVSLLSKDHKRQQAHVAHLVSEAWIGPRPGGFQIDHKDGDKRNNFASNLHYVTPKENANAGNHERPVRFGEKHPDAKISDADVIEIRRLRMEGMKYKEIAKMFKVGPNCIGKIIRRETRRRQNGLI